MTHISDAEIAEAIRLSAWRQPFPGEDSQPYARLMVAGMEIARLSQRLERTPASDEMMMSVLEKNRAKAVKRALAL